METKPNKAPASACVFACGPFEFGDNGAGSKSAPVTLQALGGDVLTHWWWGPCIQDLSGMQHRDRIPVDYLHDPGQIVGYVNKFDTTGNVLTLSGALVPQRTHQRTEEIIDNARAGVPYQASIQFTPSKPSDLIIETVQEGVSVIVNGKTHQGPLTIFRKWPLRGVAICPHGADGDTSATIQTAQGAKEYEFMTTESKPVESPVEAKPAEGATQQAVEAQAAQPAVEVKPVEAAPVAPAAVVEVPRNTEQAARDQFAAWVADFGKERAADYFAQGLTDEQARAAFLQALKADVARLEAENKELRAKLAPRTVQAAPADASQGGDLWAQYRQITDPREQRRFYEQHRAQMQ